MPSREDGQWVASLTNSRVGRVLAGHLASVEARAHSIGHESACQEALGHERVLLHAMARSAHNRRGAFPCGLPSNLPRFIAVLNLSGERCLVYSDQPSLVRCLCSHSAVLHHNELAQQLLAFEAYPMTRSANSMRFVLLTYSLPWQSGTSSAFWHLSSCTVETEGELGPTFKDRVLQFSSVSAAPLRGKSVLDPRDAQISLLASKSQSLTLVTDKQISDFSESYSATCLDFDATPEVAMDGKNAQLLSLIQGLTKERKRDQAEMLRLKADKKEVELGMLNLAKRHEQQLEETAEAHAKVIEEATARSEEQLALARQQCENLRSEMASMQTSAKEIAREQKRSQRDHEKFLAKYTEMERQQTAKDALHNAALSKHVATISKLEGRLAEAHEKAETTRLESEKAHASLLERERSQHAEAMAKATTTIESKKRIINQLSENNERRDVEVASLKSYQEEQERRIEALTAETAALSGKLKSARPRSRHVNTCTASTSTHHCASTQTDKEPKPDPAVGEMVMGSVPKAAPSYQSAIDLLQQLVLSQEGAPRMVLPHHHHHHPHPHPHPHSPNGYDRPLPFPHFTPHGNNHAPYAPSYAPHYHNGPY